MCIRDRVIESGHPLGLFKSKPEAPRVIITNALMVGLYDNQKDWYTAMPVSYTHLDVYKRQV